MQEQQEIIQAQTKAIAEYQERIHALKVQQGKDMLPSQKEMHQLQAKGQDLEEVRQKLRTEIGQLVSPMPSLSGSAIAHASAQQETEIEANRLALEYHKKEKPWLAPEDALVNVSVRSSYENEAKRSAAVRTPQRNILDQLCCEGYASVKPKAVLSIAFMCASVFESMPCA